MMIPLFVKIRIKEKNKKGLNLFIPFFLVWFLFIILFILLIPFLFIAALIFWPRGYGKKILASVPLLFSLIYSLPGLRIQVEEKDKEVFVSI